MRQKPIPIGLEGIEARVLYHQYNGFGIKSLLVSLGPPRRVLSTHHGFIEATYLVNHYNPSELWQQIHDDYRVFESQVPGMLGLPAGMTVVLSTAADMDNLAVEEQSYDEFAVCCIATAGAKNNALRMGVDRAGSIERDGSFESLPGTINILLLTNARLTDEAMVRAIVTATEAKTASLQDLDIRSTFSPEHQATGTGTDGVVVVPGDGPLVGYTGGHGKMGELMGVATRTAVAEAIRRQDGP